VGGPHDLQVVVPLLAFGDLGGGHGEKISTRFL